MSNFNSANVYKGRDSMKKFFDPDRQPPLPLVELPDCLNPFRNDDVRIYAKMMTALPCQNVKALPALNMLQKAGPLGKKTIVEPSSGSTVTSISMISRVLYGNSDVHAYVSNKTEESRLRTLQFFGLQVVLYGGPAQPVISDPRGQIQKLKKLGEVSDGIYNPGQYENIHNPESHVLWTGPQLLMQLPEINIFCAGMGSAGCITGTGTFLKSKKPSVTILGQVLLDRTVEYVLLIPQSRVCNKVGDSIPGPRPLPLFETIDFPWKKVTDAVKEINSVESYRLSMAMSREGIICGPSSGMALKGLFEFLQDQKDLGKLPSHAEPGTGEVSCVIPCCDLPYQYMDTYFQKLSKDDFKPIANLQLSKIDQGTYNTAWELSAGEAVELNHGRRFTLTGENGNLHSTNGNSRSTTNDDSYAANGNSYTAGDGHAANGTVHATNGNVQVTNGDSHATDVDLDAENGDSHPRRQASGGTTVLDLRQPRDFALSHVSGSVNSSIPSLEPDTPSPFDQIPILETQFAQLEDLPDNLVSAGRLPRSSPVLTVCYSGETARLATSIMRRQGIEAYSVRGGFASLAKQCFT